MNVLKIEYLSIHFLCNLFSKVDFWLSNASIRVKIGCVALGRHPYICGGLLHLDFLIHPRVITKDSRCQRAAGIIFSLQVNVE